MFIEFSHEFVKLYLVVDQSVHCSTHVKLLVHIETDEKQSGWLEGSYELLLEVHFCPHSHSLLPCSAATDCV